ncbi:MAG TPA: LLM class flavin-dependent oxidoreductase [Kribbella sp.]|uniref:LLM class flavin-dependent oxidoreductase n=1 Tax=Kribbella sp. TaxID=1871183 RepID=UPI002D77E321|nr:LLM class flavin-dependent oxidoreductase [Kribbella sp.]HET6293626.1 LLM class flavin-dependent oxidoreductase [Kribbella sp.]
MNPVQFGVFVSPQYADVRQLRDHVQAAESTGFDYVSIQDHPYSPAFLDTFALIGTLIGRLRFMPNVANLPLRPPAMLAKTPPHSTPAANPPTSAVSSSPSAV